MEPSICRKAESDARCADAGWGTLTWLANTEIGNASGITVGLVTLTPRPVEPAPHPPQLRGSALPALRTA